MARDGWAAPATSNRVVPVADLNTTSSTPADPVGERFRALFETHFDHVIRSLRRLGVREADLDDVAQELFYTVHRRLDDLGPGTNEKAWLFAFAVRFSANYRRLARHRETPSEVEEERVGSGTSPEGKVIEDEDRALVLRALDGIQAGRRAVFIMHDLDEIPVPEIARALEIPLNTAYSQLRLARDDFRREASRLAKEEHHD